MISEQIRASHITSAIAGGHVITSVFCKSPETATLRYATHVWQGKLISALSFP